MLETLKRAAKDTLIYGVGETSAKLATFLLIPLYTRYLAPSDFGVLSIALVLPALLADIANGGIIMAFYRFYFDSEQDDGRRAIAGTAAWFNILSTGGVVGSLLVLSGGLAGLFFGSASYQAVFQLALCVIFLSNLTRFGFALLRVERRTRLYAALNLVRVCISLASTIYFVAGLKLGVAGVLLGQVTAEGLILLTLAPTAIHGRVRWKGSMSKLREMLRYSVPLLPAGVAGWVTISLPVILVGRLSTLGEAGLFGVAARLGWMITALITTPFQLGWAPIAYSLATTENPRPTYARVLTYFTLLATGAALAISLLSTEVLKIMATSEYVAAHATVPFLAFGAAVYGVSMCFLISIEVAKKTIYITLLWTLAAAASLGLDFLLVPLMGRQGAAVGYALTFLIVGTGAYFFAQRAYRIPCEIARMTKAIMAAVGIYLVGSVVYVHNGWINAGCKLLLLAAYPFILYLLGFFYKEELHQIAAFWRRLRRQAPT